MIYLETNPTLALSSGKKTFQASHPACEVLPFPGTTLPPPDGEAAPTGACLGTL